MLSLTKSDELATKLNDKLERIDINRLARQSGFVRREPRKIKPLHFLVSYFLTVLCYAFSYRSHAKNAGLLSSNRVSKQAIFKRTNFRLVTFLEMVLAACLFSTSKKHKAVPTNHALSNFNRVIVEDSTHINLPACLAKSFPGSSNGKKKENATLKIRASIDLLREQFLHFYFSPFRKNDQSAADDIVSRLQPGDLILRDLGFFVLAVFRLIAQAKAFFISPLKYGVKIYKLDGKTEIDLVRELKKSRFLDINTLAGAKEKLPCRVVALPVSEELAAKRRRDYKANRDRRLNPSKRHLTLLGWDIFITNVPPESLTATQVAETYDLRWRIEIIFKAWKSHFNITKVPYKPNPTRIQAHILAMLIFITIFQVHFFMRLYRENLEKNNRQLSLLKVAQFFKENLWAIVYSLLDSEAVKEQIFYHCSYDNRKDRQNYAQQLLALG